MLHFCGFRYYNLDAYYQHKMEKELKKGFKKVIASERTVFNDEEQRRYVNLCNLSLINWKGSGIPVLLQFS